MRIGKKTDPTAAQATHAALPLVRPAKVARDFAGYLFICGLHRSGTTLLEELVHAHFETAVLRADVPENEGQHLQDVLPPAFDHGGPGRFAFAPQMHPEPPQAAQAARARDRILRCWTPWATDTGDWLLEKSPPNLTRIAWLRAVFPGARFLIITRDPRAVAAATRKWAPNSHGELIYHWHVAHVAARAAMGPDCWHIRYEDLCDNPVPVLETAGVKLGLPERARPLPLPERFRRIENSNLRYMTAFPQMRFGTGVWSDFGYDLPA